MNKSPIILGWKLIRPIRLDQLPGLEGFTLNTVLNLKPGATVEELGKTTTNHIIVYGEFMGTYGR